MAGSGRSPPHPELTVSAPLRSSRYQRHLDVESQFEGSADVSRHWRNSIGTKAVLVPAAHGDELTDSTQRRLRHFSDPVAS